MLERINKVVDLVTAASSFGNGAAVGVLDMRGEPVSGSFAYTYRGVWGIMVSSGTTGMISMSYGGGINLAHLTVGVPIPCRPAIVSASAGTVYILA